MATVDYQYWNYFLTLESDFVSLSKYIAFTKNNLPVYSAEILKLFLAASSEFEVVMKEIGRKYAFEDIVCAKKDCQVTIATIRDLIDKTTPLQQMKKLKTDMKNYDIHFSSVREIWNKCRSWWVVYNAVKHNRSQNYRRTNLRNALKALSSLFLAELFLYEKDFHNEKCSFDENMSVVLANLPETQLFELSDKKLYMLRNASFFA